MARKPPTGPYEVGYGSPPVATRFKPGQSGNPRGRPRARPTIEQKLHRELDRMVTITENGKAIRLPLIDVIVRRFGVLAAKGGIRDMMAFVKLVLLVQRPADADKAAAELSDVEKQVLEGLVARFRSADESES